MPSAHMTTQLTRQPNDVWPAVKSALASMGGSVSKDEQAKGVIEAKVSVSLFSWGENVRISVAPADGGSVVSVESRSRFPLTLIDWGKNKRNVNRFLDSLNASTP